MDYRYTKLVNLRPYRPEDDIKELQSRVKALEERRRFNITRKIVELYWFIFNRLRRIK